MTPLEVLNLSLAELGQPSVNFFDPKNEGSRPETNPGLALARIYTKTIDSVQRSFRWQELTQDILFKSPEERQEGGWYTFKLGGLKILRPIECLDGYAAEAMGPRPDAPMKVVTGNDGGIVVEPGNQITKTTLTELMMPQDGMISNPVNYRVQGGYLLAPVEKVMLRAIVEDTDPANWSSELLDCIVLKLAADGAINAVKDGNLSQLLTAKYYQEVFPQAKRLQSRYKQGVKYMPWGRRYTLSDRVTR
jgi:hypothetical protein